MNPNDETRSSIRSSTDIMLKSNRPRTSARGRTRTFSSIPPDNAKMLHQYNKTADHLLKFYAGRCQIVQSERERGNEPSEFSYISASLCDFPTVFLCGTASRFLRKSACVFQVSSKSGDHSCQYRPEFLSILTPQGLAQNGRWTELCFLASNHTLFSSRRRN